MLAVTATKHRQQKAAGTLPSDLSVNWHSRRVSNSLGHRTRHVFCDLRHFRLQLADVG
jgi:hypothetical protein